MMKPFTLAARGAITIDLIAVGAYAGWLKKQPAAARSWLESAMPDAKAGKWALLPAENGRVKNVVAIISDAPSMWDIASLPLALPEGTYQLDAKGVSADNLFKLCIGYGLGAYQFTRYKKASRKPAELVLPQKIDAKLLESMIGAISASRDLVNTTAEDLGPSQLAAAISKTAKANGAKVKIIKGDALLKQNFPLVHAVGRASEDDPHLVDFTWGNERHPKVTLVGKGVTFDTGGLDIKNRTGMYHMKMDMGGAASVLAVARMVMEAKLPVRLRVIVPAVENSISDESIRPSDVIKSRAGITVEIQDTDAEGRLILADALALAAEEKPDVIIDMATLTGASLVALGGDVASVMASDDKMAQGLVAASRVMEDPAWHMPIWDDYAPRLESNIADTLSCTEGSMGDAIHAALFMKRFALPKGSKTRWAHIDMNGAHSKSRPGRPEGGEAQMARTVFWWLRQEFSK